MSSSKSRSVSVEIVPPSGPRPMDLAGAINGALANNGMDNDRDDYDRDLPEREPRQARSAPPKPTASPTTANAPTPCERCVRTSRVCKGVAGARCEYCKRLKQRCTNSSGPARGKNAAAAKKVTETPVGSSSKPPAPSARPPTMGNIKRKRPEKSVALMNGDADDVSLDGEGSVLDDDDHELPPRLNKKRRAMGNKGPSRSELQKVVSDLDASVKRIQSSITREVDKVNATIKTLNAMISEMESD